ncbi:hypothetical protein Sjap_011276 [Stephania japonica]|uniref:Universal stress protein n=1 Tax=Stephania japonica TaxID=461633 RepID=A0AAP0JBC9_9MAGN
MLGKSMKILEVDKRSLMLSSSLTQRCLVVVNGSRKSNYALKWALERFSDEGKVMFKLLHVRARITTVPTPNHFGADEDNQMKEVRDQWPSQEDMVFRVLVRSHRRNDREGNLGLLSQEFKELCGYHRMKPWRSVAAHTFSTSSSSFPHSWLSHSSNARTILLHAMHSSPF